MRYGTSPLRSLLLAVGNNGVYRETAERSRISASTAQPQSFGADRQ
ncbi:hypothetical protein X737_03800 [Mesorhizobium sp. L48C026A00]|nr:hypothetical protein X737_03800 [Mesorhizobium sp. L48C026A00]